MTELTFTVLGSPVTQGSKRAFVSKSTGRPIVVDDNAKGLRDWRRDVVLAAKDAMPLLDGSFPLEGPVQVRYTFRLRRPKSAPRRVLWPATRPDWEKLARAISDALKTAGVYRDDGQIVRAVVIKTFATDAEPPGVIVEVSPVRTAV